MGVLNLSEVHAETLSPTKVSNEPAPDCVKQRKKKVPGIGGAFKLLPKPRISAKPGCRRVNRQNNDNFSNHIFAKDNRSLDGEELKELFSVKWNSQFEALFASGNRDILERIREVSEEEQNALLEADSAENPLEDFVVVVEPTPQDMLMRVDRRIRFLLKKASSTEPFVQEAEADIVNFLVEAEEAEHIHPPRENDTLTLAVEDPYHRLLLHGMCQFYGLRSHSVDKSGLRCTVISAPEPNPFLELEREVSLCALLATADLA